MFITKTTDEVYKLFEKFESENDICKLKFLIYVMEKLYNKQINSKNISNPNLLDDSEDLGVLDNNILDFSDSFLEKFIYENMKIYNKVTNNNLYLMDGNVIKMDYKNNEKNLISDFEKLNFNEKIDVVSELFIRYDNDTYYENNKYKCFELVNNKFEFASLLQKYKLKLSIL